MSVGGLLRTNAGTRAIKERRNAAAAGEVTAAAAAA